MNKFSKFLIFIFFVSLSLPIYSKGPKYIFFFIGDGMGFGHVEASRIFLDETKSPENLLFLQFPVTTQAVTQSADHRITDSSAAATALATGTKTVNNAVGVDSSMTRALTPISKQLKEQGRQIGIITTATVNHATPAGFYASQPNRNWYYPIGKQAAESGFDFFAGASLAEPRNKKNPNDIDLYSYFRQNDYTICKGIEDYKKAAKEGRMVVLYDTTNADHIPYEIDRKPEDLSLKELTKICIDRFMLHPGKGFFMMVEGGIIDWAAHSNDAATMIQETIGFNESIKVAYDFYRKHPKETLIIVTADHETGGIGLGIQDKNLPVALLQHQKVSKEKLSDILYGIKQKEATPAWEQIKTTLKENLGLWEHIPVSYSEEADLMKIFDSSFISDNAKDVVSLYSTVGPLANAAVSLVNQKVHIGWTSNNHTGIVVPVYAIGAGQDQFTGRLDNTDIPNTIRKITGIK